MRGVLKGLFVITFIAGAIEVIWSAVILLNQSSDLAVLGGVTMLFLLGALVVAIGQHVWGKQC